jgi:hypothetical protein
MHDLPVGILMTVHNFDLGLTITSKNLKVVSDTAGKVLIVRVLHSKLQQEWIKGVLHL